jgi:hypothetical protein
MAYGTAPHVSVREQRTAEPSASTIVSERTVLPQPLNGTATVGVDRIGAGDAEVVVRLHDRRRESNRVELGNDRRPAGARRGRGMSRSRVGLEPFLVEASPRAVLGKALAAHRVPRGACDERTPAARASAIAERSCSTTVVCDSFVNERCDSTRVRREFAGVVQHDPPGAVGVSAVSNSGPESLTGRRHWRPASAPIPAAAPSTSARRVSPGERCSIRQQASSVKAYCPSRWPRRVADS